MHVAVSRYLMCTATFPNATDSEWVSERGGGRLEASRQSGRQKQPENMGKEDLLTVFVPCGRVQPDMDLFELWRLVGSRVTLGEEEEEEKEMKRGWEEWKKEKLTAKSHRDIVWNREQVMGRTTGNKKKHGWKKQRTKKINQTNWTIEMRVKVWQVTVLKKKKLLGNKPTNKATISSWKTRECERKLHVHLTIRLGSQVLTILKLL